MDAPQPTPPVSRRRRGFIPIHQQRSLAGRYPWWIKGLSLLAMGWAFLGWLNEAWFYRFDSPLWLNHYSEYAIILIFGLWRVQTEQNPYTRKRLIFLLANVVVLWWLIPWLYPFVEPYVGYLRGLPVFPSLHTPGTLTFFLVLAAVGLFGRRIICGWNCPCVAIREVVGFPFRHRDHLPRGLWAWRLRHLKWFWLAFYLVGMWAMTRPANTVTTGVLGAFALSVGLTYFISLLLSPWIGNRGYCRFLCPYGAAFGLLNRIGPFRIDHRADTCTRCGRCTKVCDMAIPVWEMGVAHGGRVETTECMGCGRCVTECPTGSLAFRDARSWFWPALRQDRTFLRRLADWSRPAIRWRASGFFLLLMAILAAARYYATQVGTLGELSSRLGALCGLPLSLW